MNDSSTISLEGEYVAMSDGRGESGSERSGERRLNNRISVDEIARRLEVGRMTVYTMLEQGMMPGIRLGRRWIITRHAYEHWERTCGMQTRAGLHARPEVTVLQ